MGFAVTKADGSFLMEKITPGGSTLALNPSSSIGWLNSCQDTGATGVGSFDPTTGDFIVQCGLDLKRITPDGTTTTIYRAPADFFPPKIENGHIFIQVQGAGLTPPAADSILEIGSGGSASTVFTPAPSHFINSFWTLPNGNLGVLDQTGAGILSDPVVFTQYSVTPSGTATQISQWTTFNSFLGCFSGDAQGNAYCQDGSSVVTLSQSGARTQFFADISTIDPAASFQGVEQSGVVFIGTADPDSGALNGFRAVGPGGSVTPVTGNW